MGMRSLAALLIGLFALAATPLAAQEIFYEEISYEVVEMDGAHQASGSERYVESRPAPLPAGIASYGPFRVLDGSRAALVDVTDGRSLSAFRALLRDHPGIGILEMIDCPGTEDDLANLQIGRIIRQRGIVTHVPAGGSVRSGAVELFLAGARRFADPGSEFAVHAWMDHDGLQATDYSLSAPENARYLAYYRQMGMSSDEAAAFYAMTNSVPFEQAKWLDSAEMSRWVRLDS
ncbi:MAG: alpha/beta hydrolase [Novosphingobium sp.]|nr:alpha/beta hydrolase [Novosphingobium sp.]